MHYSLEHLNRSRLAAIKELKNRYHTPHMFNTLQEKKEAADLLLEEGVICFKGQEPVRLHLPAGLGRILGRLSRRSWWVDEDRPRGLNRLLHGHEFVDFLMAAYRQTGRRVYLDKAYSLIEDYCRSTSYTLHKNTFAFHDETTALRLENWIHFTGHAFGTLENDKINMVLKHIEELLYLLADDSFFVGNNNHGMQQSLALLKGAAVIDNGESRGFVETAMTRIEDYIFTAFTEEGIHNENSPQYHLLVMYCLENFLDVLDVLGMVKPVSLTSTYGKAMDYVRQVTCKGGVCMPLGDTYTGFSLESTFLAPRADHFFAKDKPFTAYTASGYVFFYDKKRKMNAAFTASYIHNFHKHNDDLQLVVNLDDTPLLIDPGHPGYEYKDPMVVYGRSSRAHNTLTVDDIEPFRTLERTVEDGRQTSLISDFNVEDGVAWVKGENRRVKSVKHIRTVTYTWETGVFLLEDQVESNEKHQYTFNWHFDPMLTVTAEGQTLRICKEEILLATLKGESDSPFTLQVIPPQKKPHVQGYCFDVVGKPEPSPAAEAVFVDAHNLCVRWILRLNG